MTRSRLYVGLIVVLALGAAVLAVVGYREATAPPLVRRLTVEVPSYPADAAPVRILLFSDLHVQGPDMPPERVGRIVDRINALHPDVIVGAGDFLGESWFRTEYPIPQALAPLRRLKAKYGVYAVTGNNDFGKDYSAGKVIRALERQGIHVLVNQVSRVGPLALGGRDGRLYAGPATMRKYRNSTYQAMAHTPGIKVLIVHRPDEIEFTPAFITLVLAGHTHCGQIYLPVVGALFTGSDYGQKYRCGVYRYGSKVLVVTAGLGTSKVPVRIGAPPDMWLIELRGSAGASRKSPSRGAK